MKDFLLIFEVVQLLTKREYMQFFHSIQSVVTLATDTYCWFTMESTIPEEDFSEENTRANIYCYKIPEVV